MQRFGGGRHVCIERVTMLSPTKKLLSGTRATLAGAVMLGTVVLSLSVAVPSSSAGESAFCKSILSFQSKYASKETPPTSIKGYKGWAKEFVPLYETLASEAPNDASKTVLNEIVTILKYESTATSATKLETYIEANQAKFEAGDKALAKDIEGCV
jgi:hypothetical protein